VVGALGCKVFVPRIILPILTQFVREPEGTPLLIRIPDFEYYIILIDIKTILQDVPSLL
jgi:hypothetical protein